MKKLKFIYLGLIPFFIASCAQILAPTGGDKDILPPKLTKINPDNQSLNVLKSEFMFTFNEFIQLQNPTEKILISPPLNSKPEFIIKGKTLVISVIDTLKPNTTYSFVFSDCIRDITEGNVLPNFTYAFSTGNFIDSNIINGKVINAENLEPEKNIFVLLYKISNDSLPLTTKPYYITKTNEKGFFTFGNITQGEFWIYALNDKNNNLIRDQLKEPFAFNNSKVISYFPNQQNEQKELTLRLFNALDTSQNIVRSFVASKGVQMVIFKNPLQNPTFTILKNSTFSKRFIFELNPTKDSLKLYDTQLSSDTIYILAKDGNFEDTVFFVTQQEPQKRFSKKGMEEKKQLSFKLYNADELYKTTFMEFDYPINELIQNKISIIKNGKDTITGQLSIADSLRKKIHIEFVKEEKTKYAFEINDSLIVGYNLFVNDTIKQSFTVKSESDYGSFFPKIKYGKAIPVIIQLTDEKGNIIQEIKYQTASEIEFKHLKPATYRLMFLFDTNHNGKWDTGDYAIKLQPETKIEFNKRISIKPNWDIEEDVDLDKMYEALMN